MIELLENTLIRIKGGEYVMNLVSWVLLGLVAGIIANAVDPRPAKGGILSAMLLGIVGAFVGGFLASALLGIDVTGFNLTSIGIAVLGSLLMLWVGRMVGRGTV